MLGKTSGIAPKVTHRSTLQLASAEVDSHPDRPLNHLAAPPDGELRGDYSRFSWRLGRLENRISFPRTSRFLAHPA